MMNIEVAGTLTADDFVAANQLQEGWIDRAALYIDIGFFTIGVILWLTIAERTGMVIMVLAVIGIIGGVLWSRMVAPYKNRRLFDRLDELHGPMTYVITDAVVRVIAPHGKFDHSWSEYIDLDEDDDIFSLSRSQTMMEILPKRWFPDIETIDAFREYAIENVLKNIDFDKPPESD